jgi:hypothetical protein
VQGTRGGAEEAQVVDRERQLAIAHHGPRLAGLLDLQSGELVGVLIDEVGKALEHQ